MSNKKITYVVMIVVLFILLVGFLFSINSSSGKDVSLNEIESSKQYGSLYENFTYFEPDVLDEDVALSALINAEQEIKNMEGADLSINLVNDKLLIAKRYFVGHNLTVFGDFVKKANGQRDKEYLDGLLNIARDTPPYEIERKDLSEVVRLTQEISFIRKQAYDILDYILILEENKILLGDADVSSVDETLDSARLAVKEERYSDAVKGIEMSEIELDVIGVEIRRVGGLAELGKGFLEKHWLKILIVLLVMGLIYRPLAKLWRIESAKNKIKVMKIELETLNKLMKKAQIDCFKDKKITEATYKVKEKRYRRRINEIKHKLPVLNAIVGGKEEIKEVEVKKRGILEFK